MSLLIHPSSLGKIMTEPKSKTETLSEGAKTYIKQLAKENVYGYREQITSKYMEKGTLLENDAIEMYNRVFFTDYTKNDEVKKNNWLVGCCDIDTGSKIIDIKCSWSLATFPATSEDGVDKGYEWQGRGYMMLWDRPTFENAYCMLSTPLELIKYEQEELHLVDFIPEHMRITIVKYERDLELEKKIVEKVEAAQEFYLKTIELIKEQHNF